MADNSVITVPFDDDFGDIETLKNEYFTLDIETDTYVIDKSIDVNRVQRMSKEYPALKKAWENFNTIYKMVDQDYKGNYENN